MRNGQCPPAGHAGPDRMRSIQSRSGWETRVPGHPSIPHDLRPSRRSSVETPVQTVITSWSTASCLFSHAPTRAPCSSLRARRGRGDVGLCPVAIGHPELRRFSRPPQTPPTPATPTARVPGRRGPARSLSIDEAVQLALQQNLGIQIERLNPQLQDYTIAQALVELHAHRRRRRSTGGSQDSAAQQLPVGRLRRRSPTSNFGFQTQYAQLFPWGTNAAVSFDSDRADHQQHLQLVQPDADRQPRSDGHAAAAAQLPLRHRQAADRSSAARTVKSPTWTCSSRSR